jgi:hypothetical protein
MVAPRIRTLLFGLVLLTALQSACAPKGPPRFWIEPVAEGDRVRVWAPSVGVEGWVGTLLALRPDTIVVGNSKNLVLEISSLTKLEVSRGNESKAGTGGIIGFVGGAVAGAVICLASECSITVGSGDGDSRSDPLDENPLVSVGLAAVVGGAVGYGVGVLIGSTIKVDRWEEIPLDQLRVTIAPCPGGGLSVGLRVRR